MNSFVSGWLADCIFANGNLTKHDLQSSMILEERLVDSLFQSGELDVCEQ